MTLETVLSNVTSSSSSQSYENPRVGSYELLETLGRGNFGKVRRARHIMTGEEYAIKIVDTDVLKQDLPGNLDIRREMSILRGLQHPNIVYLHEVMVSKCRVYMVMDLALGGDFFQFLVRNGKLETILAKKYFKQLVDAISYCHDHGVYHRDLKPENMLLTNPNNLGNLKITDFGFSAMKDHGGCLLRTNCGSPHYCAPEVWNGTRSKLGYDGSKADSFSIGVILYVLLTGAQPFSDSDEDNLLHKVDKCQVHYPHDMCNDAVDLLSKLLVRDPDKRWNLKMVKRHTWYLSASIDEIIQIDVADIASIDYDDIQDHTIGDDDDDDNNNNNNVLLHNNNANIIHMNPTNNDNGENYSVGTSSFIDTQSSNDSQRSYYSDIYPYPFHHNPLNQFDVYHSNTTTTDISEYDECGDAFEGSTKCNQPDSNRNQCTTLNRRAMSLMDCADGWPRLPVD